MPATFGQSEFPRPKVLAVLPCLNEAAFLEDVVSTILAERERIDLKIVIADGGSVDGSREIAERLVGTSDIIDVFHNSARLQSCGMNGAVDRFGAGYEYLLRVDVHAAYPENYCGVLLKDLAREKCDSVVVSMNSMGESCFQRATAAAQNSRLGNGGSAHRNRATGRFVDHGHHALMTMRAFKAMAGYDPSCSPNEDAELDIRLGAAGFRIFLSGNATIGYFVRPTAVALFRQYRNHGRGRARTIRKHWVMPKIRQVMPLGVVPALLLLPLAIVSPLFALPAIGWAAICVLWGAVLGVRAGDLCRAGAGPTAMLMHLAWSLGFLEGFLRADAGRERPESGFNTKLQE